jgi:hypothetical protein
MGVWVGMGFWLDWPTHWEPLERRSDYAATMPEPRGSEGKGQGRARPLSHRKAPNHKAILPLSDPRSSRGFELKIPRA